jgi:tetrahydromethanopterin S-methyltransferase subunit B
MSVKLVKRASMAAVVIALAAIIVVNGSGVTSESAVAACNADVQTVEIAVATFQEHNPGLTVTVASLLHSLHGGPFLSSWPKNGGHYSVSGYLSRSGHGLRPGHGRSSP